MLPSGYVMLRVSQVFLQDQPHLTVSPNPYRRHGNQVWGHW